MRWFKIIDTNLFTLSFVKIAKLSTIFVDALRRDCDLSLSSYIDSGVPCFSWATQARKLACWVGSPWPVGYVVDPPRNLQLNLVTTVAMARTAHQRFVSVQRQRQTGNKSSRRKPNSPGASNCWDVNSRFWRCQHHCFRALLPCTAGDQMEGPSGSKQ